MSWFPCKPQETAKKDWLCFKPSRGRNKRFRFQSEKLTRKVHGLFDASKKLLEMLKQQKESHSKRHVIFLNTIKLLYFCLSLTWSITHTTKSWLSASFVTKTSFQCQTWHNVLWNIQVLKANVLISIMVKKITAPQNICHKTVRQQLT